MAYAPCYSNVGGPFVRLSACLIISVALAACSHPVARVNGAATVHQYAAGPEAILVNGYIIETEQSLIAVDATLTVSSATAFRRMIDGFGKPLVAIVVTHAHPDHYNGLEILNAGIDAPVYATRAVRDSIATIDGPKEIQWRPVFGAEWPTPRAFPNRLVEPEETLTFDGVQLNVVPIGAAESHADSIWVLTSREARRAFIGDLVFSGTHAYACDGHTDAWIAALGRLNALAREQQWLALYPGHGAPWTSGASPESAQTYIQRQTDYLNAYRSLARAASPDGISNQEAEAIRAALEQRFGVQGIEFLVGACAQAMAASE